MPREVDPWATAPDPVDVDEPDNDDGSDSPITWEPVHDIDPFALRMDLGAVSQHPPTLEGCWRTPAHTSPLVLNKPTRLQHGCVEGDWVYSPAASTSPNIYTRVD